MVDLFAGRVTVLEVATALTMIPNGDPLWVTLGGMRALSDTARSRIEIAYLLASQIHQQSGEGKNSKRPEPEAPPPIHIVEQRRRASHRANVNSAVNLGAALTMEDRMALYRKQIEVDSNGGKHTPL